MRAAQVAVQTFNGPMADANDVYRPVTLPSKPGAQASMTDAQRDDLEHQIHCQCGCNLDVYTCRTTDFSCSVSPAMHADVMSLVAGGHGAQEILNAFRAAYGEKVLMAPLRSGFNLVGYTMPFIALGTGAVIVAALLKRWKSRAPAVTTVDPHPIDATAGELAELDAAVRRDV
jgi:cytochrome c-type biogenesis protein CcmH